MNAQLEKANLANGAESIANVEFERFRHFLRSAIAPWGMEIGDSNVAVLFEHHCAVNTANRRFNLTRITGTEQAAVGHYADSLALVAWAAAIRWSPHWVIDVGTGAGFPSTPMAVVHPEWEIIALDATAKKIEFLREFKEKSGLSNLHPVHGHSGHWRSDRPADLVVSRATGSLGSIIAQAHRNLGPGGKFVSFKTLALREQERDEGRGIAKKLGLAYEGDFEYQLQLGSEVLERCLVVYGATS